MSNFLQFHFLWNYPIIVFLTSFFHICYFYFSFIPPLNILLIYQAFVSSFSSYYTFLRPNVFWNWRMYFSSKNFLTTKDIPSISQFHVHQFNILRPKQYLQKFDLLHLDLFFSFFNLRHNFSTSTRRKLPPRDNHERRRDFHHKLTTHPCFIKIPNPRQALTYRVGRIKWIW